MSEVVLLTGFAGFIGSQLLRDLLERNYTVIGIDNLSDGSSVSNYSDLLDNRNFIPIISDMSMPYSKFIEHGHKIDYIINCAAESHVDRSWDEINKFIDSNIKGPMNLASLAIKQKIKKFVQVSTDEVWGGSLQPFTESSSLSPENIYSTSKASAELFLENYRKAYGLPLVITNGANTYGKRQMHEKVIPKTVYNIARGVKVPLYKTRAQRMWLHVEDHSSGIIAAMERGKVGERYCLAPNEDNELYTDDLIQKICEIIGVRFEDCVSIVPDRLNYDLRYNMLNDKAKIKLHWNPRKKIKEELPAVVMWYKNMFSGTIAL